MASGDMPNSPIDLQRKFGLLWGNLGCWKIIPMGKGFYTFNFDSEETVSRVWAQGAVALKPGTMRFMKWVPNFSPSNQRNTNSQVWVKFWDLGLEFWEPRTLFEIASGIGIPVKIDPNTLDRRFGLFARVLVDIDLSSNLPTEVLIKRKNGETFVQSVDYEKLPDLCSHCGNVGHRVTACKHVQPAASIPVEHSKRNRGRSRKRRARVEKKRGTSQVYVSKQPKGKAVVIASTPPPLMDCGEGPSFVRKSPVENYHVGMGQVPNSEENALVPAIEQLQEPRVELTPSVVGVEIDDGQNVDDQLNNGVALVANHIADNNIAAIDSEGVCESDDMSVSSSPRGVSSKDHGRVRNWFDETERVQEEQEFTQVLSKAQRRSQRQATRSASREAYLRRSKEISQ
ncbi:uncharacterized protein LOC112185231 [Rosa chinensis]|uniref:uncharacterized protein LOC112185231 n=1 Tax=Rosa chinensis TaxID=74649 RepID=UPI000D091AE8|nr:uncharacterized protein LOC112185231 [Rosa chinensis]